MGQIGRAAAVALALVAAIAAVSPSAAAHPREVTAADLAGFQPGVTTYADVVAKLGTPSSESVGSNGLHNIAYATTKTHVKAATFIPYVGMFAGGAKVTTTWLTLSFDPAGRLTGYQSTTNNADCSVSVFGPGCSGGMPAVPVSNPAPAAPTPAAAAATNAPG